MRPIKPGTHRVPLSRAGRGVVNDPADITVTRPLVGTQVHVDIESPFVRLALTPEVARVLLVGLDEALG